MKENGYESSAPPNLPENIIKITKEKYLDAYRIITGEQLRESIAEHVGISNYNYIPGEELTGDEE